MTRASLYASAAMALTLTLATGCDKASDEQQKANAAQAEANNKIAAARTESTTKVTSAQLEADNKIAAAESDFGKRREEYRHTMKTDLIALDKKIELLEAKAKTATGKTKTDLDASLPGIRASRTAFSADMTTLDSTTAMQWDSTKTRMDKDWSDLKAMVDKAPSP